MDVIYYLNSLKVFITTDNIQAITTWLALLSLCTFILSLILLPYIIKKIPSNYFLTLSSQKPRFKGYNVKFVLSFLFRNIFGTLLFVSGVAMLFLPGQGLLTIFISLLFIDFPYKNRLLKHLTNNATLQKSINWLRAKVKKKPFDWPQ